MYSIESGLFFFQHYLGIIQGISYYMVAFVWWVCYVLIRVEVDQGRGGDFKNSCHWGILADMEKGNVGKEGSRVKINIVCSCGSEFSYSGVLDSASEGIVEGIVERWLGSHEVCAECAIEEEIDEECEECALPHFLFSFCTGAQVPR